VDEGFTPGIKTFSNSVAMEKCAARFKKKLKKFQIT